MDFSEVTLRQLSRVTDRNSAKAAALGLKLSWQVMDEFVVARISDNFTSGELRNFPLDKHFHLILADIQYWFWQELLKAEELLSAKSPPPDTRPRKWKTCRGFVPEEE